MVKVLIKKLNPKVNVPSYKTKGASGMDLMAFIEKPINLKPGKACLVPTGLSVAFPEEYEIQIRPRSGLAAKNNISILNTPGTIDSDYRGEIKIILFNHSNENFIIKNNDLMNKYNSSKFFKCTVLSNPLLLIYISLTFREEKLSQLIVQKN